MNFSYISNNKFFNKIKKMNFPGLNSVDNSIITITNHYFLINIFDENNFFNLFELYNTNSKTPL